MKHKGISIIEAVLSVTIFATFITTASTLLLRQQGAELRSGDQRRVKSIIEETYEAVQSIAYNNWSSIADGVYGLARSGDIWILTGTPDYISEAFLRQVTLSSIRRGTNCEIDPAGFILDSNSKQVDIAISWNTGMGTSTHTFSTQIMNWKEPNSCFAELDAKEADLSALDISTADVNSGQKSLEDIILTNDALFTNITINTITLSWETDTAVRRAMIDGQDVWNGRNGVGLPQEDQPSGSVLDIVDVTLAPGESKTLEFRFENDVIGDTFMLTIGMADGSTSTTHPFAVE